MRKAQSEGAFHSSFIHLDREYWYLFIFAIEDASDSLRKGPSGSIFVHN